jgi:uncharacterized repeat protein (TIGR03803 family)
MYDMTNVAKHGADSGSRMTTRMAGRSFVVGLLALVCAAPLFEAGTSAQPTPGQTLHGQVPPVVRHLQPLKRMAGTNRLELVIGLPLRNREALTSLLGQLYDPASSNYHRYLTPAEFTERFGPAQQDYEAVMAFAKANGLRVIGTHPNRTLVDVSGSVGDIERTFHVKMQVYRHPDEARTFHAPDTEPSLDLAVPVLAVNGLDDFVLPYPMSLRKTSFKNAMKATPYATGAGPRGTFIGRDFRAAYAPGVSLDGAGQAVGLLEFDGYYTSDVLAYESLAGLPNVTLTNVLVNDFSGQPGANNVEVALDIDMAISMAPGLAKVIVYEGKNGNDILNRMATDNQARQLSSSWGFGTTTDAIRDQIFLQFILQGQSFFQASADDGARCVACPPHPPSDNPFVTVVGGTILTTSSPGGTWVSETTWPGSGGGVSTNYTIPSWQQGIDMTCNGGSTAMRNYPDVACVADAIWLIANNGEEGIIGGTSASAPLWAGFAALVNQQAAASGQPSIGFINPAIYAIGKSSAYASAFRDITTGNNTNTCCGPSGFFACPGYDLCTGWGTPAGSNLIAALLTPPSPLRITPVTPFTFTGPFGGPFRPTAQGFVLTNDSNAPLNWTVTHAAPWLNVSPANGTLTNGGPATTITVTLTPAASVLPVGSYSSTLWFTNVNLTNLNDRLAQSRQVDLDIVAPPVITLQPTNQTVFQGMTAAFTVATANGASCSYQWQYDNGLSVTNLADGGNISGSATSTLVISNASPANAGAYSVIVSNAGGAVSSSDAFLAVFPWRPVITSQPSNQTVLAGETVTFTVAAVGSQPLFYLWQRNGTYLNDDGNISGSSSGTLTIRSASLADAGTYSVIVGNADGLTASAGAVLTVISVTAPGTTLTALYSFTGGTDGGNPNGLLRVANGGFYGTTQNGGTNFAGTVFQMTAGGTVTDIYSFTGGEDGANPFAALTQGPDGNLYGTAFQGGVYDNGTVFRMTPNGVLSNLVSLNITNGSLPYAGLTLGAGANFYGTTYQGGAAGRGTVFRISVNGVLTTLYSFTNGLDGGHLAAGLVKGSDGSFYGTTYKGGAYGYGTVFSIATNGAPTSLVSFDQANGAFSTAELVEDASGMFFGTTTSGGTYNNGAVFRMTPSGLLTSLYSFGGGSDGSYPTAALLQGRDGNLYGTTAYGGVYGDGTLFRMAPDGALTTLVDFDGYVGANPQAALIEDADGSLLGTTQNGGATDEGVIFRLRFSGPPQITCQPASQSVYVGDDVMLSVAVSGASPFAYQWRKNGTNVDDGGNLAGSTNRILSLRSVTTNDAGTYAVLVCNPDGFTNSVGAVLQVTSSPPIIVRAPTNQAPDACTTVSFNVVAGGNKPLLYQWQRNGINLAETCNLSGSMASRLILSPVTEADNGTYTVIVSNSLDSARSAAVLTVVPRSALCTSLTTRHWFSGGNDGRSANGLAQAGNGILYGTTYAGGNHLSGTIFSLATNGAFATLTSFTGANGANPTAAPVQGLDGRLYGTTFRGGAVGAGTVFAITTDGALSTLYSFTGDTDGAWPSGELVLAADGNFYGTTAAGGLSDYGTVFRITPSGALTNLHLFTGADGRFPTGAMAQGCDGSFYGLTSEGGAYENGTVFRITPAGAFTMLYSFTGGSDGYAPVGALVRGADCNFYGATKRSTLSGFQFYGTVFRITSNGGLTTLHTFGDFILQDGLYPYAGLVQSTDGNLYGTTYTDRLGGYGTVFRVSPDGSTFATLVYFDGCNDGARPQAALTEDTGGNLYGSTTAGGPCQAGQGTLFRLSVTCPPQITAQPASQAVVGGANVVLNVAVSGARPFSYHWRRNGTNLVDEGNLSGSTNRTLRLANVSLADAGTYSVIVSNALSSVTSAEANLTIVYPPVFLSAVRSNCTLALSWSAMAGQRYRLQYRSSLAATNWAYLGSCVWATGDVAAASDNICTNAQRFYRVVLFPQIQ